MKHYGTSLNFPKLKSLLLTSCFGYHLRPLEFSTSTCHTPLRASNSTQTRGLTKVGLINNVLIHGVPLNTHQS